MRHLGPADPLPLSGAVDIDSTYDNKTGVADQYAVFMYGLDAAGRGTVVMRCAGEKSIQTGFSVNILCLTSLSRRLRCSCTAGRWRS